MLISPHGPTPSYATDLVVCVALGCDMFDCVFPTRTAVRVWAVVAGDWAVPKWLWGRGGEDLVDMSTIPPFLPQRFGSALVPTGNLQLKKKHFQKDFRPIDPECSCPTCQKYERMGPGAWGRLWRWAGPYTAEP